MEPTIRSMEHHHATDAKRLLDRIISSKWLLSSLLGLAIAVALVWLAGKLRLPDHLKKKRDASEPGLFKKHSTFERVTALSGQVYPRIRVFYHAHSQAAKLPPNLPLLVFMHGLGGNATQFTHLLTSLINIAPCLAIDLPGCGRSDFKPDSISAYTTQAFAELLYAVIDRYRDVANNQQVIFIGHSMGCSITALLSSSTSPLSHLISSNTAGMISICPRSNLQQIRNTALYNFVYWIPPWAFDLLRVLDRRGGLKSASITRVVGGGADTETRKLQRKFNRMSKSAVVLRMIRAALSKPEKGGKMGNDSMFPGKEVWSGVKVPLFLVAAEADCLASPMDAQQIAAWLGEVEAKSQDGDDACEFAPDAVLHSTAKIANGVPSTAGDKQPAQYQVSSLSDQSMLKTVQHGDTAIKEHNRSTLHAFALKLTIFPPPAAHGLIYATNTVRVLSGLIEGFIARHVDQRVSLGWQLQHLSTSGKWEVKNLAKWQKVEPCSAPIGRIFRAMKTMREVDDEHNPKTFVKKFSSRVLPDGVAMIVDISHESPVYNPTGLENGGVEYHKFPTVSKLPPTADEVEQFISLVDRLRQSPKLQATSSSEGSPVHPTIGVHCHYGFNRTGFFIVCYLIERLNYKLQDAIEEFAEKRSPGIKHDHFLNELFVRYAVRMERRGTIVS